MSKGWIGVGLDGTLAEYFTWNGAYRRTGAGNDRSGTEQMAKAVAFLDEYTEASEYNGES